MYILLLKQCNSQILKMAMATNQCSDGGAFVFFFFSWKPRRVSNQAICKCAIYKIKLISIRMRELLRSTQYTLNGNLISKIDCFLLPSFSKQRNRLFQLLSLGFFLFIRSSFVDVYMPHIIMIANVTIFKLVR